MFAQLKNKDWNPDIAVISLINKHFWKSKIGPIAAIILPVILMLNFKLTGLDVASPEYAALYFASFLRSYLTLGVLPLTLITLPQVLCEFKRSIILRKISISSINKYKFCFMLMGYYLLALSCSSLIVITLYAAFLASYAPRCFAEINWWQVIYALINLYGVALITGLFIGVVFNSAALAQLIGFMLFMYTMIITVQFTDLTFLGQSPSAKIFSLFSPLSYPIGLLSNATVPKMKESDITNTIIASLTNLGVGKDEATALIKRWVDFSSDGSTYPNKAMLDDAISLQNIGTNIFNLKNPLVFVTYNVDLQNTGRVGQFKPITIITPAIYDVWYKILNIVMPLISFIAFGIASSIKFKWSSR